ncbi:MAG: hypothetical protein KAJ06_00815 [Gammaproteobacteria bacterium]|nr:hypothetical protein [Gammaproteobacteria bacterium]
MKAKEYIALKKKKDKLEAQLENLKDEMALAESDLMAGMVANGLSSVKTPTGSVRIDRKIWASSGGNVQGMIEAMRADGLDDLVSETVNGTRLSGWAREYDDGTMSAEEVTAQMPQHVREAIKVTEKIQLIVTPKN